MINQILKSVLLIISSTLLFCSCEVGGIIKDQLSMIMDIRKGFGGEWEIKLSQECFTVEITNSPRLLNNPDSMNYYGAMIGRQVINKMENPQPCMRLIVKSEKKLGMAFKSNSSEYVYNLRLIRLFENKPIAEHPKYITAAFAALSAVDGDIDYAIEKRRKLDSIKFEKDYINLIDLLIAKYKGETVNIDSFLANLPDKSDSEIFHLAVESFKIIGEKETTFKLIKQAFAKDPGNSAYMMMNGNYCYQYKAYSEAASLFGSVIEQEPENLRAWHSRAWAKFKMGKKSEGCDDINQMYVIKPKVNMPDSTKVICGLEL